jgi:AcrR family transcriptional regulator
MNFAHICAMRPARRRQPKQRRARQTVEAVLDAVARVVKRHGVRGVTTNRIAVAAGVSIGSVYQYFPDKRAIFAALLERHVDAIGRVIESTVVAHAGSSLPDLVRALIDAMVDAHAGDPELHELLFAEVPHAPEETGAYDTRLRGALRLALAARGVRDLDKALFVVTHMVESLSHGAVLRRPPRLSLAAAKAESVRAILAYLRA